MQERILKITFRRDYGQWWVVSDDYDYCVDNGPSESVGMGDTELEAILDWYALNEDHHGQTIPSWAQPL